VRALGRGKVDVALLTTSSLPKGSGLRQESLFADEVVLLLSAQHPLARRRTISALDLASETLITGDTPAAERSWFMRSVFGRRRPKLSLLRFPLTEAVVDAARARMGIAVLSEWIAGGYLERAPSDLVVKRLTTGPLLRPWRLAYRPELVPVVGRLKSALQGLAPRLPRS
jgi:LysR family transcriptional regulator for metE and metH